MKPQDFIGDSVEYDKEGQIIWGVTNGDELQMLLNVRGWGAIQHLFDSQDDAAKFQDEVGQWITDAINEKLNK
jgi:hypothetical protein